MRNDKGITLISLVATVLILMLLSSVTMRVSIETYNVSKIQNFIAKMQVIQSKVDNIAEQDDFDKSTFTKLSSLADGEEKTQFYDMIKNASEYNIDTNNSWNRDSDSNPENYYYFTPDDLQEKLGLESQDQTVVINFETRNVISKKGVKKNSIRYYRQYDISGGNELVNNN